MFSTEVENITIWCLHFTPTGILDKNNNFRFDGRSQKNTVNGEKKNSTTEGFLWQKTDPVLHSNITMKDRMNKRMTCIRSTVYDLLMQHFLV